MATSTHENGVQVRFNPLGHHTLAVDASIYGLPTPAVPLERVRRIVIRPLTGGVVYTDDGTSPSSGAGGVGIPILADEVLVYDGQFPENFKMTRNGATTSDVRVAYYGT